jgi:hypothetical protein
MIYDLRNNLSWKSFIILENNDVFKTIGRNADLNLSVKWRKLFLEPGEYTEDILLSKY